MAFRSSLPVQLLLSVSLSLFTNYTIQSRDTTLGLSYYIRVTNEDESDQLNLSHRKAVLCCNTSCYTTSSTRISSLTMDES